MYRFENLSSSNGQENEDEEEEENQSPDADGVVRSKPKRKQLKETVRIFQCFFVFYFLSKPYYRFHIMKWLKSKINLRKV